MQYLAEKNRRLASANVASQGGLTALRRGEAHFAGSHLLDPQTGEFNISYIRQYMPNIKVKVVALVGREQGLIVKKNNPKRIKSLKDVAAKSQESGVLSSSKQSVQFVNRQRGSGTRTLLDYHLNQLKIPHEYIAGYHQDEYTHLGVATAVASGRADCGLGIAAAAQALDLDFVPLFQERYDLVIPKQFLDFLTPLFDVLTDSRFQTSISSLKGYDVSVMGTIILEDE
ncbi:MAG: substrate-binding domain-containing protein [Anaerolineales bacterium]